MREMEMFCPVAEELCFNCFYNLIRADNMIQETKGAVWKNDLIWFTKVNLHEEPHLPSRSEGKHLLLFIQRFHCIRETKLIWKPINVFFFFKARGIKTQQPWRSAECLSCPKAYVIHIWTVDLCSVELQSFYARSIKKKMLRVWKEMCWHDNKDSKWAIKPVGTGIDTGPCAGSLCS